VIQLDAATVLLQWATGGLAFLWVTTRHREVGLGYGWTTRGVYVLMAVGSVLAGVLLDTPPVARNVAAAGVAVAAAAALAVSVKRKSAGVSGQRAEHDRRTARVAAMTGIERTGSERTGSERTGGERTGGERTGGERTGSERTGGDRTSTVATPAPTSKEFPPALDLVAPIIGAIGLLAAGLASDVQPWLAAARNLAGAAFLGAISDAMLLGHWYLVQPGLPRRYLNELNTWVIRTWPIEVGLLLVPTGMISVLNGSIDDGWEGILGWMWVACAATTLGLALATRAALKERYYSAVMAATGLLYLAILTAFGTDLVARAVLAG
jgi:hypothetical protein